MSKLIEFTNLLHRCGSGDASEVRRFLEENKDDRVFRCRAEAVLMGFAVRESAVPTRRDAAARRPES